jgi:hypothetical protein
MQCKLRVYPLWKEDVFKDIARIPRGDRGDIREGSICTISVNSRTKQLIVRGVEETLSPRIMLDAITREAMGDLQEGMTYDFTVTKAGIWRQIIWACTVADPGARIAAWIGVTSVMLGIAGLVLGVIGVWLAVKN